MRARLTPIARAAAVVCRGFTHRPLPLAPVGVLYVLGVLPTARRMKAKARHD